jgi:tetratricopeptide (TPR) repeat protein
MAQASMETEPGATRFAAFISYSHQDRTWAEWLHHRLETFEIPEGVAEVGTAPPAADALRPVFIDRAELPTSPDLAASVRAALENSAFLIVVCSPAAAHSRWVDEEVRYFKALGRADRILCLIVAGEPSPPPVAGSLDLECFPPALRFVVADGKLTDLPAPEPLAADVRPGKDFRRTALLKIVAGILRIRLDRLTQREHRRRHRQLVRIAAAAIAGCVVLAALAVTAVLARYEAERERRVAVEKSLTAQRTADFLKSLFYVSDPSEARGRSVTALEVLNRGVEQIDTQLRDQPAVRADILTTLGEVYASLGLLREGGDLIMRAESIPSQAADVAVRQMAALGDIDYQRGDFAGALVALQGAVARLDAAADQNGDLRMRVWAATGDVQLATEDLGAARQSYERAMRAVAGTAQADPSLLARATEGLAQCDLSEKHYAAAKQGFEQALAAQIRATGERHPRVAEILNELGSLHYLQGQRDQAGVYFRRTLDIDRSVLGEQHPSVAITRNNLARVLLERRRFADARVLLEQSVAARAPEVLDTDAQMAFLFSNLALVNLGTGDYAAAERLFTKALAAARANKHRLLGPILADLADLECRTGRAAAALARLDEARPIVAERYPDDPWRAAHVDNVRAGCLTELGRYAPATALMESSAPTMLRSWPGDTLYGHDVVARAIRLYALTGDAEKLARYRALAGAERQSP